MGDQSTTLMMMSSIGGAGLCCLCCVSILGALAFMTLSEQNEWIDAGPVVVGKDTKDKDVKACYIDVVTARSSPGVLPENVGNNAGQLWNRIGYVADGKCKAEVNDVAVSVEKHWQPVRARGKYKWIPSDQFDQEKHSLVGVPCYNTWNGGKWGEIKDAGWRSNQGCRQAVLCRRKDKNDVWRAGRGIEYHPSGSSKIKISGCNVVNDGATLDTYDTDNKNDTFLRDGDFEYAVYHPDDFDKRQKEIIDTRDKIWQNK
jgi:hypothetical protein